jgi:hypothetical protein
LLLNAASAFRDPEARYSFAAVYNACMGNTFTTKLMKSAIDGGYCSYDYLQLDAILATFPKSAEYPSTLARAKQCQDRFLNERNHPAILSRNRSGEERFRTKSAPAIAAKFALSKPRIN